jgi:hypothetical protein
MKTCSICSQPIDAIGDWVHGHNAEPVNDGRCCSACNDLVVIPARLAEIYGRRTGAPSPSVAANHRHQG